MIAVFKIRIAVPRIRRQQNGQIPPEYRGQIPRRPQGGSVPESTRSRNQKASPSRPQTSAMRSSAAIPETLKTAGLSAGIAPNRRKKPIRQLTVLSRMVERLFSVIEDAFVEIPR